MTTKTSTALLGVYSRLPVTFERGEGVWLYDTDGRRYLDLLAGLAVCSLGHAHPDLVTALSEQAGRLWHVSNLFSHRGGEQAAAAIVDRLAPGRVFFCNSGAEANEAAIKLARKRTHRAGERDRNQIVVCDGSFHGRTLGALAATMQPGKQEGFGPLPDGFVSVPLNDTTALERAVGPRTAAVLVEPIQGESGVRLMTPAFAQAAQELCRTHGALLACDEVQTGVGRTGRWWGFEHLGITPDVVTLAKGLGGGFPVGAMWVAAEHAEALGPGDHATTFGGNPLACATVSTVLEVVDRDGLVDNARAVGERLAGALGAVRGAGLLLAVELDDPVASDVTKRALERGIVVNAVTSSAIRLAPPLVIDSGVALEGASVLREVIDEVKGS